jgi:hypothetical protein
MDVLQMGSYALLLVFLHVESRAALLVLSLMSVALGEGSFEFVVLALASLFAFVCSEVEW